MEASRLLRAALASRLSIYFITPSRIPPHMVPDRGWVGSTQGRIPFSATDGARAPPLLLCAADDFRFLAASVVVKFRRATPVFFCKGGARSNPSNRGDPFLASLRAIMGEGGMDTTTRRG